MTLSGLRSSLFTLHRNQRFAFSSTLARRKEGTSSICCLVFKDRGTATRRAQPPPLNEAALPVNPKPKPPDRHATDGAVKRARQPAPNTLSRHPVNP